MRDTVTYQGDSGPPLGKGRHVLAIVAPGQGAQTPGFLEPWLELPRTQPLLQWWSAVSGIDLIHYGTKADAEEIRNTAIAQPLLVAAGLIGGISLFPHPSDAFQKLSVVAGHSVGELTAAAGARDHCRKCDGLGARTRHRNGRRKRSPPHRNERGAWRRS